MGTTRMGLLAGAVLVVLTLVSAESRADEPYVGGRTYAVLVGVADYPRSPLPRTDVDAERIARALETQVSADRLELHLLLNRDATHANVTRALREVVASATERDELIFFFSGHGGTEPDEPGGDEGDGVDETLVLYDRSLRDDELASILRPLRTRFAILALDSCFSGGFLFDVANHRGRMSMFSSNEDLTSAVPSQEAGGWLSLYLAEALEGRADGFADGVAGQAEDGQLTALEIETYVRERFQRQQRVAASDPSSRTVGYQVIQIQRVGVAPDSVFMTFGGPVSGGFQRRVVLEREGVALPATVPLAFEVGRTYVVETFGLSGRTDTVLELRRGEEVVAENDDDGQSLASRVRFTVEQPGSYSALVRPYSPETGGTFGLRVVELVEVDRPIDVPSPRPIPAPSGSALLERTGVSLPGAGDATFEVELTAGRSYTIETFDLAGSTDTVLELRQGGRVLAENDDDGRSLASRIQHTATQSGRYTIRVRPYDADSGGTFSLRVLEAR